MLDEQLASDTARAALSSGGEYSDVILQRRLVTEVRFEDGRVDDISTGLDCGAGVRVIRGDLAAYAHTDVVDREHLARAAETAAGALKHAVAGRPLHVPTSADNRRPPEVCPRAAGDHEINEVVSHLRSCDEAARGLGPEIVQVTASHAGYTEEQLIANSLGEVRKGGCRRTRLVVQVVASRDGVTQVGQEAPGALCGVGFYTGNDPVQTALTAGRRALVMLDARPSPTGKMPVVIHSGTGGVLLHEACGHGLEADHMQKGASVFAAELGKTVASGIVSAADNPTIPGLWGSYEFDDEGTPAVETVVIESGVLRDFLYGRHEAMKEGRASTGNGRRQSFRFTPIPRMSNTYIKPAGADPSEIISSTAKGLFAKKMGGGQVDPVTGDYVFAVSEGYLIERGEVGPPVRGAVLIGNGPRTLELIDAVGDDLSFEAGTCGKGGQGVPVTTGCPTFRIEELTVGGTEM